MRAPYECVQHISVQHRCAPYTHAACLKACSTPVQRAVVQHTCAHRTHVGNMPMPPRAITTAPVMPSPASLQCLRRLLSLITRLPRWRLLIVRPRVLPRAPRTACTARTSHSAPTGPTFPRVGSGRAGPGAGRSLRQVLLLLRSKKPPSHCGPAAPARPGRRGAGHSRPRRTRCRLSFPARRGRSPWGLGHPGSRNREAVGTEARRGGGWGPPRVSPHPLLPANKERAGGESKQRRCEPK